MTAVAQDARGQARNRELALERLRDRLARGAQAPAPAHATRPTAAARRRRLEQKRHRSERKRARRRPSPRARTEPVSSRSAVVWVGVFLVLAFAGGGGFDLLSSDDDEPDHGRRTSPAASCASWTATPSRCACRTGAAPRPCATSASTRPRSVKPGEPVQCFGTQASEFNERLVDGQARAPARSGASAPTATAGLLAYVYVLDGAHRFVNAELLRRGYARTLEIPPNTDFADRFDRLERRAREQRRGLWRACGA